MNRSLHPLLLFNLLLFSACLLPDAEPLDVIHLQTNDTIFQKIHDLQDREQLDSLLPYFEHQNASYRYLSAMAIASIQDSLALDQLYTLLEDPVEKVRAASAFAIGQIGNLNAVPHLIGSFAAVTRLVFFN